MKGNSRIVHLLKKRYEIGLTLGEAEELFGLLIDERAELVKDKRRIDFLQDLTDEANLSGNVIMKRCYRKGWVIREVSFANKSGTPCVREAIDDFRKRCEINVSH